MNISAVNFNKTDETQKKNSININSNKDNADKVKAGKFFDGANVSSTDGKISTSEKAEIDQKSNAKPSVNADVNANTGVSAGIVAGTGSIGYDKDSVKSMLKEADSVTNQIKNSAETAKSSFKALVTRLSGADAVKIDEDGYNLNDLTPEKMVTVVDRIKIMLATYCDDYNPGDTTSIDTDQIKEVVGSASMASRVKQKFSEADIPQTDENVEEATNACNKAVQLADLSEDAKNYLVKNQMEPSIENIYKAEHMNNDTKDQNVKDQNTGALKLDENIAGNVVYQKSAQNQMPSAITEEQWQQLLPQIQSVIEQAGIEVNEQNLNNAKTFLKQDIPVTKETLMYKAQLDHLDMSVVNENDESSIQQLLTQITDNMKMGNSPESTKVINPDTTLSTVENAIKVLQNAGLVEVAEVGENGKELTIENLQEQIAYNNNNNVSTYAQSIYQKYNNGEISAQDITNYRQLEEIRIMMTADAGMALAKQGFNLDTTPVAQLVDELKSMETQLYGEKSQDVFQVQKAVADVKAAPDVVIGAVLAMKSNNDKVTIGEFAQTGNNLKQKYQAANETYESVGTQVRSDLGDSLKEALQSSTKEILGELGLESTQANQDAIRILANNGMEITQANISKVKEIYSTLNNMIDNMHPDTVFSMIQDGINPMDEDISTVNQYLSQQNTNGSNDEKFSKFLYKLDKTKGITDEERNQFIGIYKMVNIFRKDAGKAVGALVKQNADITMSNLITAYKSVKASGIDRQIDDQTGMAEVTGTVDYYNNLFAKSEKSITPNTLKTVNNEKAIIDRSVENFCEAAMASYDASQEDAYYSEYIEQINRAAAVESSVIEQVAGCNEEITVNNVLAAENIMSPDLFKKYYHLLSDSSDETDSDVNDFTQKAKGVEILDQFVENCISADSMDNQYDKLQNLVEQTTQNKIEKIGSDEDTMTRETLEEESTSLEDLRMMGREIGVIKSMSRRNDYKIPFLVNGEAGTINLKLIQNDSDKGNINIKITTQELGDVSVNVKLASSTKAVITADNTGDSSTLEEKIGLITDTLSGDYGITTELNIEDSIVMSFYNRVANSQVTQNNMQEQQITFNSLYEVSKEVIKSLLA